MVLTEITMLSAVLAFAAPFVGMIHPAMGVLLIGWVAVLVTVELCWRRWEAWKDYDDEAEKQ